MNTIHYLSISGRHYRDLQNHLFPGDGKEAVALAICGRHQHKDIKKLLVHDLIIIPYEHCQIREPDYIKWSTDLLVPFLEQASRKGLAIVKFHSHPTGYNNFSETDNQSDVDLFDSVYGWMDNDDVHGSVVMLPGGSLFGRVIKPDLNFVSFDRISIVGDDIRFYDTKNGSDAQEFNLRTTQTFGPGTTSLLNKLKICVVGCSGTGSPVIEQLVRLGVGQLILIDPDRVEKKNLNRILNSTIQDAKDNKYKTDVLRVAMKKIGLGTQITTYEENLYQSMDALADLATCDIIFGCVDSVDGRHLLNQLATFYLIPYFDLGVKIIADGIGGIDQICGTVHYLQPGGSSLKSRGLYDGEELRAAGLFRIDPAEYDKQKKHGYISNVNVDSPAVISINMQIASIAVNEFLARIHSFRYDPNEEFAITRISLSDAYIQREKDGEPDNYLKKFVGRGKMVPLLNMTELS